MDFPELSLAPTHHHVGVKKGSGLAFDHHPYSEAANASRKRKLFQDHHSLLINTSSSSSSSSHQPSLQAASVDLQLKDPLPLDWEQCLDLQSGKMYYLNRKTLKKSWNWPAAMEQNVAATLDLELNISTFSDDTRSSDHIKRQNSSSSSSSAGNNNNNNSSDNNNNNNNMMALACLNCHLLVILSKSSPACPNCKYVHSLPSHNGGGAAGPQPKLAAVKSLSTLSLLN